MDTERMHHATSEYIPEGDGEVHSARHQVGGVIAAILLMGVHQAGHLALVTSQDPMGWPAWKNMSLK